MAKAVMISIQPQWCEKIASGRKTVEVRKTRPKLEPPFKCYIYCTNAKPFLVWGDVFRGNWETEFTSIHGYNRKEAEKIWDVFNGHVIGEFICDKIFDICIEISKPDDLPGYPFPCTELTDKEILQYLGNGKSGFGWHISKLQIYDEPKKLDDYYTFKKCNSCKETGYESSACIYDENCKVPVVITRPPQSWCYVEEK